MATNILIIGDSHVHALKAALARGPRPAEGSPAIQTVLYARIKDGKEIGDLTAVEILESAARLGPEDFIISCLGGNQHQMLALIQHPQPFDVLMPDMPEDDLADDTAVVPYHQIFDLLERGLRGKDGTRLLELKRAASCGIYHLQPPPPKEDVAHLLSKHETAFAQAGIKERGITKATTRLKIWKIQVAVLDKLAREWGIGLLPPPKAALTAEGFLSPDYYANDATHGNQRYGALVIEQILQLVNQTSPAP